LGRQQDEWGVEILASGKLEEDLEEEKLGFSSGAAEK